MNTLENHEVDSSEEHTDEEIYSSEDEEEEHAAQEKEAHINDNEEVEGAVNQPQTRGGDVKAEIMRPASSGSGSRHNLEDIHDGERRGDSGNSNLMLENLYSHGITHWIGGDDATIDSATVDEVITEADMYKGTEEVDEASSTSHASRSQSRKSRNESRNGRTSASRAESGHHSRSQNNKSASISGTESMNGATTTEERRPESRDEGISTSRSERRSRVGSAENGTGSGNVSRSASRGSSGGGSKSTGGNRPKSSSEKGINGYSRDESRNNNRSESGSRKGGDDGHTSEGTMTSTPIGEDYRNSEDFIDFINNSETNNSNGRTGVGDTGEVGGDGEGSETDVVDMEEATSMRASSRHGIVTIEWDTIKKVLSFYLLFCFTILLLFFYYCFILFANTISFLAAIPGRIQTQTNRRRISPCGHADLPSHTPSSVASMPKPCLFFLFYSSSPSPASPALLLLLYVLLIFVYRKCSSQNIIETPKQQKQLTTKYNHCGNVELKW